MAYNIRRQSSILIVSLLITCVCSAQAQTAQEMNWMEAGKDAVRQKLKDPQSAQFQKVFFHRGKDNIPMTCGEVNSKNGFGGYTGFQRFVSAGREDATFVEAEVTSDFAMVWSRFCIE